MEAAAGVPFAFEEILIVRCWGTVLILGYRLLL